MQKKKVLFDKHLAMRVAFAKQNGFEVWCIVSTLYDNGKPCPRKQFRYKIGLQDCRWYQLYKSYTIFTISIIMIVIKTKIGSIKFIGGMIVGERESYFLAR